MFIKIKALFITAILCSFNISFASEQQGPSEVNSNSSSKMTDTEYKENYEKYIAHYDANLRDKNHYYIAPQIGLFNAGIGPGYGLKAGYRTKDWGVEASYNHSVYLYNGLFGGYLSQSSYTVDGKYFITDTFYASGGLGYGQLIDSYHSDISEDYSDETHFSYYILQGFLGNQWEFNHMTLGVDWIGLSWYPVSNVTSYKASIIHPTPTTTKPIAGIILFRIYCGVSF